MQEEGHLIVALFPAHVAGERIFEAVVSHVHRVKDNISKGNVAELATKSTGTIVVVGGGVGRFFMHH